MEILWYQARVNETAVYPGQGTIQGLQYTLLGLAGEVGEVCNRSKKVLRDEGGRINASYCVQMKKELGDVLWYLSQTATEIGISLEELAQHNIEKLADRQKRGVLGGSGDDR